MASKKELWYVNPTFLIRRPLADLVSLYAQDYSVHVLVPKKIFSKQKDIWHSDTKLKGAKVHYYNCLALPGNFEWPIPFSFMFVYYLFRMLKAHVIHIWTYSYITTLFVLLQSFIFRKKVVMSCDTFPGVSFDMGSLNKAFSVYTTFLGWFLFSIPRVIHLYGESLIPFAQKVGVPQEKIVVLPTGVSLDSFVTGKSLRSSLGYSHKDFVLFYAGLLVPRKGIDTMVAILEKAPKHVKLLLAGDGPLRDEYTMLVRTKGLDSQVRFLGWRQDIPNLLASVDAIILPSRGEGLPGIVMEGMAQGLPIIASNIPCLPDLVTDNGVLCEDIGDFINAIATVRKHKKKMGAASKKNIQHFGWNVLQEKYSEMYGL